jgi:thymidine phosphorylase
MVKGLGGVLRDLPVHEAENPVVAKRDGFVSRVNGLEVGLVSVALGAGRTRSDQEIDPRIGLELMVRRGSVVKRGDVLAKILTADAKAPSPELIDRLANAFELGDDQPGDVELIIDRIG